MRNLGKAGRIFGALVGASTLVAMTIIGCSGDDNSDGGTDSGQDVKADTTTDVAQPDVQQPDAGDGGDGDAADVNVVAQFRMQVATNFCTRYQTCCNGLDAGTFDFNHCMTAAVNAVWNGSNSELGVTGVVDRGNVALNTTAATSCLADLATSTCPIMNSTELLAVTDNCYAATTGTLGVGGKCLASIECQDTEYCDFALDGGTTDGGAQLGECAALAGDGGGCGVTSPYSDNFSSEECAYRSWHAPPQFCDYDNYPNGGYACTPLRANTAQCYFDNECASGICGTINQDCIGTTCTCLTSRDFTPFCSTFAIQDAGTD